MDLGRHLGFDFLEGITSALIFLRAASRDATSPSSSFTLFFILCSRFALAPPFTVSPP